PVELSQNGKVELLAFYSLYFYILASPCLLQLANLSRRPYYVPKQPLLCRPALQSGICGFFTKKK
ncbi:hypothetical protein F5890DRAFT_1435519, partial [Lentinula detonsa]